MNDNANSIEMLFEKAKDYSQTSLQLLELKVIDKSADVVSTLVSQIAIIISAILAIFIINIGIALWIGHLIGKSFYGFLIVGFFYAILAFILHLFKDAWIKNPLNNSIIIQMLKKKNR